MEIFNLELKNEVADLQSRFDTAVEARKQATEDGNHRKAKRLLHKCVRLRARLIYQ